MNLDMIDSCLSVMSEEGLLPESRAVDFTGQLKRYRVSGDKKSSGKHGWYVGYNNSNNRYVLIFGSWKISGNESYRVWRSWGQSDDRIQLSDEEKKLMESSRIQAKKDDLKDKKITATIAKSLYNKLSKDDGQCSYLERKKITNPCFKFVSINSKVLRFDKTWMINDALVIPIYNKSGDIVNAQLITDKLKLFLPKGEISGCYSFIPAQSNPKYDYTFVSESVSTGITISMATRCAVVIGLSAHNIAKAAESAKHLYGDSPLIIMGDNDRGTEEKTGKNVGEIAAINASYYLGGVPYLIPDHTDHNVTDFNDLYVNYGIHKVIDQIDAAIKLNCESPEPKVATEEEPLPTLAEIDDINVLSQYYTMIHGTESAWDGLRNCMIKLSALRKSAPSHYPVWSKMGNRKIVALENIVFDPLDLVEQPKINTFNGLAKLGDEGKFTSILEGLDHMVNGDETIFEWVLTWLAFILQKPGIKMDSSIIVHGIEGSGKNYFWQSVVSEMFKPYSNLVSQSQIESSFNEWNANKLFTIMDEVNCMGSDKIANKLKLLITGKSYTINAKGITEIDQTAYSNFVFLSNEREPIPISYNDRRYLVIYTTKKISKLLADAIELEVYRGGIAGFRSYLMKRSTKEMKRHSEPPITDAKRRLQSLNRDSSTRFVELLRNGDVPAYRYQIISDFSLFMYYKTWCKINNMKPVSHSIFTFDADKVFARIKIDNPKISNNKYFYRVTHHLDDKFLKEVGSSGHHERHLIDVESEVRLLAKEYGVIR